MYLSPTNRPHQSWAARANRHALLELRTHNTMVSDVKQHAANGSYGYLGTSQQPDKRAKQIKGEQRAPTKEMKLRTCKETKSSKGKRDWTPPSSCSPKYKQWLSTLHHPSHHMGCIQAVHEGHRRTCVHCTSQPQKPASRHAAMVFTMHHTAPATTESTAIRSSAEPQLVRLLAPI